MASAAQCGTGRKKTNPELEQCFDEPRIEAVEASRHPGFLTTVSCQAQMVHDSQLKISHHPYEVINFVYIHIYNNNMI